MMWQLETPAVLVMLFYTQIHSLEVKLPSELIKVHTQTCLFL